MFVLYILLGLAIGILASFSGLGGGFLLVPLLLIIGKPHTQTVGTSFFVILLISLSALMVHSKLNQVDYSMGLFLAIGGITGAQIGSRLVSQVSTATFQRIISIILILLALYLFYKSRSAT